MEIPSSLFTLDARDGTISVDDSPLVVSPKLCATINWSMDSLSIPLSAMAFSAAIAAKWEAESPSGA
ncbi:hypothetical protein ACQ86N_30180 [Puia sp. P3]|uniref:hypothetical protein n=1 Tax=Puia sp. P3 TaxID=3423952 RepID=UPI003D66EAB9